MKTKQILFLFFLISSPSLWGQNGTGTLEGKVYSNAKQQPIEGAQMILKKEGIYHQKRRTDHEGNYNFVDLPTGSYSIWIRKTNHCELEISEIAVIDSQSIRLDLGLMEAATNTTLPVDKIEIKYQTPIYHTFKADSSILHEKYKNRVAIIQEVYEANAVQIRPPEPESPPLPRNKATHFSRDLQAFEKKVGF